MHVVEQAVDGLVGVALGVADEADGSALDPAGGVHAGHVGAVVEDASRFVGDDAGLVVERDLRQVVREVANGPVDRTQFPVGEVAGALDVAGAVELGPFGAQTDDLAVVAQDFHGRLEEVQEQLVRAALGVADRVLLDDGRDLIGDLRRPAGDGGALVVVDVLGIDDHVDGGRVVELFELERGELGLSRSAASEHVDLGGLVVLEALVDVGGDLGGQQFVAGLGQHARYVQGDVTHTDDRDLLGLERPGAWEVGMSVVPGHELSGAVGAVEVDAGQVHRPVVGGTGGEDDSVVHLLQVFEGDVAAVVDVADQPDLRLVQHLVQRGDDALDARMIRCHAVADQAERCRHPLEQIDRDTTVFGLLRLHQGISGIDAGRTGTDDGHAKRTVLIAHESECLSRSVGVAAESRATCLVLALWTVCPPR